MAGPVELSGEPPPGPCQVPQRQWKDSPRTQHSGLASGHCLCSWRAGAGTPAGLRACSQPLPRSVWAVLGVLPERSDRSRPGCGLTSMQGAFHVLLLPPRGRGRPEATAASVVARPGEASVKGPLGERGTFTDWRPLKWPSQFRRPQRGPCLLLERVVSPGGGTAGVDPASAACTWG